MCYQGIALRHLSTLERRAGRLAAARAALAAAEPLLVEADDPVQLVFVRCERGHHQLAVGVSAAAVLDDVRQLCAAKRFGPRSRTAPAVARLARAVAAFTAGEQKRLWQGELIGDLSPPLARRLITAATRLGSASAEEAPPPP